MFRNLFVFPPSDVEDEDGELDLSGIDDDEIDRVSFDLAVVTAWFTQRPKIVFEVTSSRLYEAEIWEEILHAKLN